MLDLFIGQILRHLQHRSVHAISLVAFFGTSLEAVLNASLLRVPHYCLHGFPQRIRGCGEKYTLDLPSGGNLTSDIWQRAKDEIGEP